jgi:hypothetical protein
MPEKKPSTPTPAQPDPTDSPSPSTTHLPLDPRRRGVVQGNAEDQLYAVRRLIDVLAAQGFDPPADEESIRGVLFLALDTLDAAILALEAEGQQQHAQEGHS